MKFTKILAVLAFVSMNLGINSCQGQIKHDNAALLNGKEQSDDKSTIQWMSFQEAVQLNQTQPKKIFIDVYTHWCGWCKKMDQSTFLEPKVVEYINQHYHAVKFDAETRDTIHFRDHAFAYIPANKANELAVSLLSGKMSYPSYVFLDEKFNLLTPVAGYLTKEQLLPILSYFGSNIYLEKKWEEYQQLLKQGN